MPKAAKIVICREGVQVYPADDEERVWHVCDAHGPIAEIQLVSGPVAIEEPPECVIQENPDFLITQIPDHYLMWEDRRS